MWEFSLACSNRNKYILDYINNCFCNNLPDCMLTTFSDNHFTYLLFASDDSISSLCKSKIKKCISTYIIDVYKYEYFVSKILKNKNLISQAYVKALTLYDVDTDMALIDSLLELDSQFYIDSFITFQLKDLERMWNELCELITSNINYLNRDMMIDVMRSFISTFDSSIITIKVIMERDGFVIYKLENNQELIKLKDKALAIDVVNYIMLSNPNHIEIYGDVGNNFSVVNLLKSLYEDKVDIIK